MKRNLANLVTVGRLVLAIACLVLLALYRPTMAAGWLLLDVALLLFILAGASDLLDGYLARRFNAVSRFGRVLDPTVDKVLICGAFILFAAPGFLAGGVHVSGVLPWVPIVLVSRELLVTAMRGVAESGGDDFAANRAGKLKMFCQSVAAGWVILHVAHLQAWASSWIVLQVLVWIAVAATVLSALTYVRAFSAIGGSSPPST